MSKTTNKQEFFKMEIKPHEEGHIFDYLVGEWVDVGDEKNLQILVELVGVALGSYIQASGFDPKQPIKDLTRSIMDQIKE